MKDGLIHKSLTWVGDTLALERDNLQSGSPVTKKFFDQGVIANGTAYYYVKDQLGSVRQLVDVNGAVQAQYDYDPYGQRTQSSGTIKSDIGYGGYLHHEASGLDFTLRRAYDPTRARWLNRDPIGEAGGTNLYAYVGGNPTSLRDPSGLRVSEWARPADLPWPLNNFDHHWLKTDTQESGMGNARGGVPAQNGQYDLPWITQTKTADHTGQSNASNAHEIPLPYPVNEACVNSYITPGQSTGSFTPTNNCQTFTHAVLEACRMNPTEQLYSLAGPSLPKMTPIPPQMTPIPKN